MARTPHALRTKKATRTQRSTKSTQSRQRTRISPRNVAAKVREVRCVARAPRKPARAGSRTRGALKQPVPSITITGGWLRAAGFTPGKPCLVRAFAYRQLVVYQPD